MLRTMVRDIIAADKHCHVVAEISDDRNLPKVLNDTPADVLILTTKSDAADTDRFSGLLSGHPKIRVLAIATDGQKAFVHELRPCVTKILTLSPQTLLAAIKQHTSAQRMRWSHG